MKPRRHMARKRQRSCYCMPCPQCNYGKKVLCPYHNRETYAKDIIKDKLTFNQWKDGRWIGTELEGKYGG